MKKIILLSTVFILLYPISVIAEEGYMCNTYYQTVHRKAKIIDSYGSNLSSMAKRKLFGDLKFDTEQCISLCEGEKFKYCNNVAKWISE
jgi:hypothetical protein